MPVDAMQFFRHRYKIQEKQMQRNVFNDTATADGFENFASRLGVGWNTENALSKGGYVFNLMTQNRVELEAAYRGSWIVGALIDAVAEDMTRAGIDIETTDAKEQVKDVKANLNKLKVWSSLCKNEKWGRLYGGSIGVLQIEGQDLSSPLKLETIAKGQFKGIVAYDRWQVNPVLNDLIQEGPDLGLPRLYQIVSSPVQALGGMVSNKSELSKNNVTVHHSRVIRSIGIELPFWQSMVENLLGESILERLWDRLIAFDNATMSCASLVDRANLRTVGIDKLREVVAAGGPGYDGLISQMEMMRQFQVNEGLTIMDKEDTYTSTAYSFAGLSDMLLQFGQQLSGSGMIPLVRLFGQSPAGLNSTGESDMRNYYDGINAKQETSLRNPVDLILRVLWRSTHGAAAPDDLQFTFKPLWQITPTEKAEISKSNAETVAGAYEAGLTGRSTSLQELRTNGAATGMFQHITDEMIEEADAELDAPPNEDLPGVDPSGKPDLKLLQGGLDPIAPNPATDPSKKASTSFGDSKWKRLTGQVVAACMALSALAYSFPIR